MKYCTCPFGQLAVVDMNGFDDFRRCNLLRACVCVCILKEAQNMQSPNVVGGKNVLVGPHNFCLGVQTCFNPKVGAGFDLLWFLVSLAAGFSVGN